MLGSDVGNSTQLGDDPIGSPSLATASLDPVQVDSVSNFDSHASMNDPEQSTIGIEPVVATEATVPESIVSNVLSSSQSDFHGLHNASVHVIIFFTVFPHANMFCTELTIPLTIFSLWILTFLQSNSPTLSQNHCRPSLRNLPCFK